MRVQKIQLCFMGATTPFESCIIPQDLKKADIYPAGRRAGSPLFHDAFFRLSRVRVSLIAIRKNKYYAIRNPIRCTVVL